MANIREKNNRQRRVDNVLKTCHSTLDGVWCVCVCVHCTSKGKNGVIWLPASVDKKGEDAHQTINNHRKNENNKTDESCYGLVGHCAYYVFICDRIFLLLVVLTFYPFSMWPFFYFSFVCSCLPFFCVCCCVYTLDALTISTKVLDRACRVMFDLCIWFTIITAIAEAAAAAPAATFHYSG